MVVKFLKSFFPLKEDAFSFLKYIKKLGLLSKESKNEQKKKSFRFLNKTGMQIGLHPLLYTKKQRKKNKKIIRTTTQANQSPFH